MIRLIIIAIIFILIFLVAALSIEDTDKLKIPICILILSGVGFIVCVHNIDSSIFPIDVYRGNTTLQITYEGDTPIDSVVVWKNK